MTQTATEARVELDLKRNLAVQNATHIIHELSGAGVIAVCCRREAIWHLARLFEELDVEITTAEQRKLADARP